MGPVLGLRLKVGTHWVRRWRKATVMELVRYLSAEFTTAALSPETKKSLNTTANPRHDRCSTACVDFSHVPAFSALRHGSAFVSSRDAFVCNAIQYKCPSSSVLGRAIEWETETALGVIPASRLRPNVRCAG